MNLAQIAAIIDKLQFSPSCVDMGWQWQTKTLQQTGSLEVEGFLIRTTFKRPDRDSGEVQRGYGRWWHVPYDASESAIVKTAYAAARLILEHELMESFRYEGNRIFDPHHDVDDLVAAVNHRAERGT